MPDQTIDINGTYVMYGWDVQVKKLPYHAKKIANPNTCLCCVLSGF